MLPAKTTKLNKVQDEVKDFHPILMKLLPALPNIKDVEYNQGNHEMGADFVLLQEDSIGGFDDYVGVIAKVGGIQQNLSEIERQIRECRVARFFKNGKEKIRIREIWVVCTGTVTQNAKERIWEDYKNEKINFYDGKRLEKLIDQFVPYVWDLDHVEVGKFLSETKARAEEADRRYNLIPGFDESFYVEQDICTFPNQEYRLNLQRLSKGIRKINPYETFPKNKISLVEADMGMGKTKLLRHLLQHYSTPSIYNEAKLIPIPVSYKELLDTYDLDISRFVEDKTPKGVLTELDPEARFLLLIDGLDETKDSFELQVENLERLVNNLKGNERVTAILTSRRMKALDECSSIKNEVQPYFIRQFSLKKTIQMIELICNNLNVTNSIVTELKKSLLFKDIPKNPIAVILLATLMKDNQQEIPSNLTELYKKYTEFALGRWDLEKGLQSQKAASTLSAIMMNIAKYMLENELPEIGVAEAKGFFKNYISVRPLDEIDADDLFDAMMERTEIMAYNFSRSAISFKHRTFGEFFYAQAAVRDHDMVVDNRAFQPYWMHSFFFYLGLLQDAPKVLEELISLSPKSEIEEWLKVINMGNFFLAAYLTPTEVSRGLIVDIMVAAANLYLKMVQGKSVSPLTRLPRMHLLWLFQALIRDSYAYFSFKPALEDAAMEVANSKLDDETKYYALFFIGVILADLTKNYDFEYLLTESAGKLPADLSLAYYHETKGMKEKTKLMKKTEKRIKQLMGGDRLQVKKIHELYENPIKAMKKATNKLGI